jgi:SAM-dependent methyltransferase
MSVDHWSRYAARRPMFEPPLRPHADVVALLRALVGDGDAPVLLLGVTAAIAEAFTTVDAVDINPAVVASSWPGDTESKRATVGDWLELGGGDRRYAAVLGDGSLNMLAPPQMARLLALVIGLLEPGGRFACRLFERPEPAFSEADLERTASGPGPLNFNAFKWQLAMHLSSGRPTLPVAELRAAFQARWPDRAALARATGWPREAIDTIDLYEGSSLVYSFPSRAEFRQMLPEGSEAVEFLACGTYPLAERCPVLTFRRARR